YGTFKVTNLPVVNFASWASNTQAEKLTGDFDRDGKTDIALAVAGWDSLPVAMSKGDGTFFVRNDRVRRSIYGEHWIDYVASDPYVVKLTGDFNGDGTTDIMLAGGAGWDRLLVAFSWSPGSFWLTSFYARDFASWASDPQAVKLTGDFNGDGRTDIALTGPGYWNTLPVALSNGNGDFTVFNNVVGDFASWASYLNAAKLTRDFN
ncbi:MAG: VCBS repeat-containing protein, partial [Acidobacteria bacterium]|nr:VCBS repeat-containing protein [Acidobacteriota bacterium]